MGFWGLKHGKVVSLCVRVIARVADRVQDLADDGVGGRVADVVLAEDDVVQPAVGAVRGREGEGLADEDSSAFGSGGPRGALLEAEVPGELVAVCHVA